MPDPIALSSDAELRALVDRALSAGFEIDREIGRGGMGIVYRAKDRRLKRSVAVKLLPPELAFRGEIRSRFLREAETAAQLSHPNIVPIYTVDERDGLVFFVMACVDGVNLGKRLHDEGRLPSDVVRRILREVSDALAYAHARGVIHRDIKPDNILLDAETGRAMVTDFGIARAVQEGADSRLTATGVAVGTPAYMSPEQAAGDREIDGRSDLYSLGVVAYQMLTGELPFTAPSTPSMLMKHITQLPAPIESKRADVPPDLASAVMTLLEKEPARRFPSAAALSLVMQGDASAMLPQSSARDERDRPPTDVLPVPVARPDTAIPSDRPEYPTPDDMARWSAPAVQRFRRKFAYFAAINGVIVPAAILTDIDLISITAFWGMYIAAKYAGLWSSGYDWRDVFRQPRDRRLVDVASETIEEARLAFDRKGEGQPAERPQRRATRPPVRLGPPAAPTAAAADAAAGSGRHAATVAQAEQDRAEIARRVESLPKSERKLVADVVPSADALYDRVRSLAASLAEQDRADAPGALDRLEVQIAQLEAQANPLEQAASEKRVRQLALLKRQRRAITDARRRREETTAKLESCVLALRNMRFDVLRLHAGGVADASERITTLTERARSLAEDVDAAVLVADEVRRSTPFDSRRRHEPGRA